MHSILPELLTKLQEGPRLKEEEEGERTMTRDEAIERGDRALERANSEYDSQISEQTHLLRALAYFQRAALFSTDSNEAPVRQCPKTVKWIDSEEECSGYYCLLDKGHEGPCECLEDDQDSSKE
jgi:hypothetical protein